MSDEPDPGERRRIARKAAAFELLMQNLPTAAHPFRGDPELVERAREVLAEPVPRQGEAAAPVTRRRHTAP
ncbi:hypothetical protein ACFVH6_43380 [Spirillospora sp. NPDC127200]